MKTVDTLQSETLLWSLKHVSLMSASGIRLDEIDLEIPRGVTAIMGYSGAGKTSLLNLLIDYETPERGDIIRPQDVFQSKSDLDLFWVPHNLGLWPQYTVQEHLTLVYPGRESQQETVEELLTALGLIQVRNQYPGQLSQGEASRLAVARALASKAKVLVMDEPLVHVDQTHWPFYWNTIREYCQKNNTSLVFSTHQPELVLREAEYVICLDQGKVIYSGNVSELYDAPHSYQAATYLGPVNDLTLVKTSSNLQQNSRDSNLVRAEQITLDKDRTEFVGSPIDSIQWFDRGSHCDSQRITGHSDFLSSPSQARPAKRRSYFNSLINFVLMPVIQFWMSF